jgi:hypothetical protein
MYTAISWASLAAGKRITALSLDIVRIALFLREGTFVGIDDALRDGFTEAPGGVDQDDAIKSCLGVYRERNARPARSERTICCTPMDNAAFR